MKRQPNVFSGTSRFITRTANNRTIGERLPSSVKPMLKMTTTVPTLKTKGHESFELGYN